MALPFELSAWQGLALGPAILAAAFVRGYSGFGFSALVVAFSALVTNPLHLVPVVILCELAMTTVQARGLGRQIDWGRVWPMLAGATVAMPLSVGILTRMGEAEARLVISAIILLMSLLLLSGWTLKKPIGQAGHAGVGVVSGLANGAAVGGLPVAAFLVAQPVAAPVFRATMVAYLTALDIVILPILWWNGLLSWDTGLAFLLSLPLLALGIWLGGQRFLAASPQDFRRMAIALLAGLALLGLARSIL